MMKPKRRNPNNSYRTHVSLGITGVAISVRSHSGITQTANTALSMLDYIRKKESGDTDNDYR